MNNTRIVRNVFAVVAMLAITFSAFASGTEEGAATEMATEVSEENLYRVWATPTAYENDTGNKITGFSEAPQLQTMVAGGALPPVEERLPLEPLVARGYDGLIGKYGGSLNQINLVGPGAHAGFGDGRLIQGWFPFFDPYPSAAKSFEMVDDGAREWVVVLREGMKWSDGVPVTVDDLIFSMEEYYTHKELNPDPARELISGDTLVALEKIDDYTVKYTFPQLFRFNQMALRNSWAHLSIPKHYMSQFHADYADEDTLEALVKEEGFGSWTELFDDRRGGVQDQPTVRPWITRQVPPGPVVLTRNPYYWVIDEVGNQLPYIDEWRSIDFEKEVVQLKVLAGESDYTEALDLDLFPELKKAEAEGKARAVMWTLPEPNMGDVQLNLTIEDPIKRQVFRDKRFRFAISYALDRELINEVAFLGVGYPAQVAPSPMSPFYHEELANTAIEYDPDKANALLDEMGLDERGSDGFRLGPDGKDFQINMWGFPWLEEFAEMATDMIRAVGININLRIVGYWDIRNAIDANSHDGAFVWEAWGSVEGSYLDGLANHWVPTDINRGVWSPAWAQWYNSDGEKGEEPPDIIKEVYGYYEQAQASLDVAEQQKYMKMILDIAAENLWTVGSLTVPGFPYLINVSPRLRNFPAAAAGWWYGDWGIQGTWFFEE